MAERDAKSAQEPDEYPELRPGIRVESSDGRTIGRVREVFRDIGDVETFGAVGRAPQHPGHDPVRYGYSEGFPGPGDDYFTVEQAADGTLYVPFAAIMGVEGERVILAVEADNLRDLGWTVRPDALSGLEDEYPRDTGANPRVA